MKLPQCCTTVTPLSKTLALVLFVSLPFIGFYFGNKYYSGSSIVDSNRTNPVVLTPVPTNISASSDSVASTQKANGTWSKPVSVDKAFPIVKNDTLYLYSLTKKKIESTGYKTSWSSGSSGFGQDNPLPSPDGNFIAFINRGDGSSLYILPVGSQKALKVTNYPVVYLNSWSSDSSKILFYSEQDNLKTRKISEGMGDAPPWETVETFNKSFASGFHTFNINNGQDIYLYPLLTAVQFIDSNQILVELNQDEDIKKTRLVLFNVDTFRADYSVVNYLVRSFGRQRSFSADGTYWARAFDDGNTDSGVRIVFSKFPKEEGDVVDSAPWALIQRPLLNASGQYLAYRKRGEQIKEGKSAGQYSDKTVIWNSSSKKIINELDGAPEYWVNENILLIGRAEYGTNPANFTSFDLFHVDTQETDTILIN